MTSTMTREELAHAVCEALMADRGIGNRKYLAEVIEDRGAEGEEYGYSVSVRLCGKGRPESIGQIVITGDDGECDARNECRKGGGDIDSILRSI